MGILVVYGTTEGQTRKIAERVVQHLRDGGHEVRLYDTARRPRDLDVSDFDAVVVAASVHQRRHQESVESFVEAHLDQLRAIPTLFLSVSLSAAFGDGGREADEYINQFIAITGWQPTRSCPVAGALRYSEYDYFKEQIIEHLVLAGRGVGDQTGDHELTDWDGLLESVTAFAQSLGK